MTRKVYTYVIFFIAALTFASSAGAQVTYRLTFDGDNRSVAQIGINLPSSKSTNIEFVMPRSVPGEYSISRFDEFIGNVTAVTESGEKIPMIKNEFDAPRWGIPANRKSVNRVEYTVDLNRMERKMSAGSSSVARDGFAGFLNYSIFGWIEGLEREPVRCVVKTSPSWPIFSTNKPSAKPTKGEFSFQAADYYTMADGQIFIGPKFQVKEYKGVVPLFVASYSQQGDEYLDDYGMQGVRSLEILKDYFGEAPFPHYSIMLSRAVPLEASTQPQLAMEHLASSTYFGDMEGMRKGPLSKEDAERMITPFLHHMAHAYIPLRSYGDTYRPYVQELPPIIKNIWYNEGFMWFLVYDSLKFERIRTIINNGAFDTADAIKRMSLTDLSQLGSTTYGVDFRVGRAIFSRGALMAMEMNEHILKTSGGKKSMKDVIRFLYQWSKENKRPFTMEEFPMLINKACGIDLREIYDKWQMPLAK